MSQEEYKKQKTLPSETLFGTILPSTSFFVIESERNIKEGDFIGETTIQDIQEYKNVN